MFAASEGCVLMSSDYSQQEPKSLAALCKMNGDSQMYDVFMSGKDLYAEIASKAFHRTYEMCLEHFPEGTPIKKINDKWYYATTDDCDKIADGVTDVYDDGKHFRGQAKSILLGVLYGRGEASIAEQLGCTDEEAAEIKRTVFEGFPAIKKFEDDSLRMARELGYVTTIYNRRRRLPNIQLPKFTLKYTGKDEVKFNPLLNSSTSNSDKITALINKYTTDLNNAKYYRDISNIKDAAKTDHIEVLDNRFQIAEAERQCVNSRIQGSAADLTKAAMIELFNNQRAREIGLKTLIPIHDELIVECPEKYAKEGKQLLADIMSDAAEKILKMPIKCDVTVTKCWYGDEVELD